MHALVFFLLAATPVEVAALASRLPGATLIDASAINSQLLHPVGMLGFQDFSAFTATRTCALQLTRREDSVMGGPITLLVAVLECWDQTAPAEASTRPANGTATELLSRRLAGRFCN